MKRKSYCSYLLIALLLCGCLNFPRRLVDPFKNWMVSFHSPTWRMLSFIRMSLIPSTPLSLHQQRLLEEKLEKLAVEKEILSRQNEHLSKRLCLEEKKFTFPPIFAQVIYRQPSSWNSSIWIDAGKKDYPAIQVNSPVLSGNYLVGVVEIVGKRQSRVRLITDSSLVVSVRAVRGSEQQREVIQLVDQLVLHLSLQKETVLSFEEERQLFEKLAALKQKLQLETESSYLAKGELFGTSSPLWRSRSLILRGVGFNYDFEDQKGPARELRTGKLYGDLFQGTGITLIQEGDLLITTGMDGLFPPNIPVAVVSKVESLKEGAASFSIEAKLCCKKIDDLTDVVVFPYLGLQMEEES